MRVQGRESEHGFSERRQSDKCIQETRGRGTAGYQTARQLQRHCFRSGIDIRPKQFLPPGLLSDEGGKYERDTVARQPRSYIKKVSPDSGPPSKPEGDRKHSFPGAAPPKEPEQGRDAETGHKASHSEGEPHKEDLEAEA